jgi:hypothetical protein
VITKQCSLDLYSQPQVHGVSVREATQAASSALRASMCSRARASFSNDPSKGFTEASLGTFATPTLPVRVEAFRVVGTD